MANDDIFTATTTWQAVDASGADIATGTFSVFGLENGRVELKKTDTLPDQADQGSFFINSRKDNFKITLVGTEKLFCKTGSGSVKFGVIPA